MRAAVIERLRRTTRVRPSHCERRTRTGAPKGNGAGRGCTCGHAHASALHHDQCIHTTPTAIHTTPTATEESTAVEPTDSLLYCLKEA